VLVHDYPQFLLALCIWREARGEDLLAKEAVGWVIRNRVQDKRWPNDVVSVITQPYQFSSFNKNDPNAIKFPKMDDKSWLECCDAIEHPGFDPTKCANHYHSIAPGEVLPSWAMESKLTIAIGPFKFYKL